jgi:hypothetical protein
MVLAITCYVLYLLFIFTGICCFACTVYTTSAAMFFYATCVLLSLVCPPLALFPIHYCL